jgi:ectoine hydroxylase-related dioxygenase (phytanoyl-CoA dioxygenase family)
LEYLPGSHRGLPADLKLRPDDVSLSQEVLGKLAVTEYTPVLMNPGELAIHHSRTVHASGLNRGDRDRVAMAIRYETLRGPPAITTPVSPVLKREDFPVCWRLVRG